MRLAYLPAVLLAFAAPAIAGPLVLELPPIHVAAMRSSCADCGMTRTPRIVTTVEDDPKAYAELKRAAAAGDLDAQTRLGDQDYHTSTPGQDNAASRKRGLKWLNRAAEKDYAPAQDKLIDIYEDDTSPDYAPEKAHAWRVRMAEHGDIGAMTMLGIQYEMGNPGPPDYTQAAYWYGRAAETGSVDAMVRLATLYQRETPVGRPPFQNIDKAIHWYEQGAAKGDTYCMSMLARIYDSDGPRRDIVKAVQWYKAVIDNTEAYKVAHVMRRLGELYAFAPEIKDDAQSFDWYEKAARWYDKDATTYMCSRTPDIAPDLLVRARQACSGVDAVKVMEDENTAIAMLASDEPDDTVAMTILVKAMWDGGQKATDYLGQYATGNRGTPDQAREAARQIEFAASEDWPQPKAWMAAHGDIAAAVHADELDLNRLPAGYLVLSSADGGVRRQVSLADGLRDILASTADDLDVDDLIEGQALDLTLACQWGDTGWFRACTPISPAPRYSQYRTTAAASLVGRVRHVQPGDSWKALSAGKWSIIRVHAPMG